MEADIWISLAVALAFSAVHVFGRNMKFLDGTPRSIWLSLAGGISTAYVFVHLLPELAEYQDRLEARLEGGLAFLDAIESHIWILAFIGLAIFYGLDRLARQSALTEQRAGREKRPSSGVFWIHLTSFAIYNVLLAYMLLHREEQDLRGLLIYASAMILHFVVNDHGLREQHGQVYDRAGRWILAAMPPVGWLLGLATEIPMTLVSALFAFLAGGVVLNVLKEELPEDRESRWWAFAVGSALYAALLLATA